MQLLGSRIRLRHQSVVAPRLHARCSAQHPDSGAHDLPVDEGSTHKVTRQPAQRPWHRMNRRLLLVQTALSLAACPCCVAPAFADQDGEWDYGTHGPSSWPGMCKVRMQCSATEWPCVSSPTTARHQAAQARLPVARRLMARSWTGISTAGPSQPSCAACRQGRRRAPSISQ